MNHRILTKVLVLQLSVNSVPPFRYYCAPQPWLLGAAFFLVDFFCSGRVEGGGLFRLGGSPSLSQATNVLVIDPQFVLEKMCAFQFQDTEFCLSGATRLFWSGMPHFGSNRRRIFFFGHHITKSYQDYPVTLGLLAAYFSCPIGNHILLLGLPKSSATRKIGRALGYVELCY